MEYPQLFIDPGSKEQNLDYKKKFKYTTKFEAQANFLKPSVVKNSKLEAKASINELKSLLPKDKDFLEENDDLVFTAFNLFTANLANKNGDCVLKEDSIKIASGFVHRFSDLEHDRWSIVGHAIDHGFNSYKDNSPLSEKDLEDLGEFEPFQISLGAVIYKLADPYFANFVQEDASNPNSPYYNSVSASFEVGFDYAWIAVGSPNMADAEIITDEEEVERLTPMLSSEGGTGYNENGKPLYRIVKNPKALGFGYVQFPAGSVKGLVSAKANEESEVETIETESNDAHTLLKKFTDQLDEVAANVSKFVPKEPIIENNENNSNYLRVNENQANTKIMVIKSISDITQEQMKEVQASDVQKMFRDGVDSALAEANAEFEAKLNSEKEAKEALAKTQKDLEDALASQKTEFEKVQKQLSDLQEKQALAEKDQAFQSRMEIIDEEYSLDKDARKVIAKVIQNLGDDADFNAWKESFDTVASISKKGEESSSETVASQNLSSVSTKVDAKDVPGNGVTKELGSEGFLSELKDSFSADKGGVSYAKRLF